MNEDYCLWMGDIDPRMNESIIQNFFKLYNIYPLEIKLIKNKKTNKNKDYCFIYFKNIFEANNTLNKLKGKQIPNTSLNFKLNWANFHTSTNKTIYVGNLNPSVDGTSLFNFFKSRYKSVLKANIITDNGESKKYGFVTFKKKNDYRKSLIEMNGVFFEGTNIKVKECKKKDEDNNNINNKNNPLNLKDNNQLEINNKVDNINNNEINLNTNNLNSNSFLTVLNSINKLNWISNANPINSVNIGINQNNRGVIVNNHNNWFNQTTSNQNYDIKNYNINFSNGNEYLKYFNSENYSNRECNNFINNERANINIVNNINNMGNINKKDNLNNNDKINESKVNKNEKLEVLEKFDEITLKIKIKECLNKMLEYYKENFQINGNRVESKLKFYLIFI